MEAILKKKIRKRKKFEKIKTKINKIMADNDTSDKQKVLIFLDLAKWSLINYNFRLISFLINRPSKQKK